MTCLPVGLRHPREHDEPATVPLVVAGSLVIVRNAPDDDTVARRTKQERATTRI